jgi:hypothetical protein
VDPPFEPNARLIELKKSLNICSKSGGLLPLGLLLFGFLSPEF